MDSLVIIGNGFDRYHEIPSSYRHFKCFLKTFNRRLYNELDDLFLDPDLLWSDFEKALGEPDFGAIRKDAENCIDDNRSDNRQPDYHGYPTAIEEKLKNISELINYFNIWVKDRLEKSIELIDCRRINLTKNAQYINFNYTSLLEKVYSINLDHILYMHKKAQQDKNIIVGHNNHESVEKNYNIQEQFNLNEEGEEIENKYLNDTLKPIDEIIEKNKKYFENLHKVNKVFILGHSLSDIDKKYFAEIEKYVKKDSKWFVSYYGDDEKVSHELFLHELGINKNNITIVKIDEIKIHI